MLTVPYQQYPELAKEIRGHINSPSFSKWWVKANPQTGKRADKTKDSMYASSLWKNLA